MVSRDEIKKKGIRRFLLSFKYSVQGLKIAYRDEQSMWIHLVLTTLAVIAGFWLNISAMEWLIVIILITLVLGAELINTAVEAAVDLVTCEYHELAKYAKDLASASVFIYSMLALICGGIIFIPKIIEKLF